MLKKPIFNINPDLFILGLIYIFLIIYTLFKGQDKNWDLQVNGGDFKIIEVDDARSSFDERVRFKSGGNVGIGTTAPNASALLDVSSTTKGVLLPRMSTTQINAISSPAEGLTVYNTVLSTLCFFNGVSWQKVTSTAM